MTTPLPEMFTIVARPTPAGVDKFGRDGVYRLKRLLKALGRACGLDVTLIETPSDANALASNPGVSGVCAPGTPFQNIKATSSVTLRRPKRSSERRIYR